MTIASNLKAIQTSLPKQVTLVAVSKTKPNTDILEAYQAGQRIFGENKVQELAQKAEELPKEIAWHMIGHLQTNKVKFIAPFVSLIHGVDSLKLLKEINKRAEQNNRIIDCLLQVHIASESTKFGFGLSEVTSALNQAVEFENIKIVGLMGMATFTDNTQQVTQEFKSLKTVFHSIKNDHITTLSMGMSGDYNLAIEQGSTMVRLGSAIFGNRN
ncbi:MAG: YggS family pyridoxal phosphate-dependent enzyme [Flavobacteriales bacterium]|jgi:PLP dependent protein|nr:YggS family pyridoxal phosphate-dependent enzyme [Flavobacteriales bacterium]MDG1348506.1 YggS family pyridoxal phosphate-dependent enzyme [Flavobacteriales bacterium]|tara:strand:+ start:2165 stop:2806 length:642 start_codon:yes stop_codon:yes gene_type:complete